MLSKLALGVATAIEGFELLIIGTRTNKDVQVVQVGYSFPQTNSEIQ